MNWYTYEAAANEKGYQYICGIDEAGRGLWPVLFLLPQLFYPGGL